MGGTLDRVHDGDENRERHHCLCLPKSPALIITHQSSSVDVEGHFTVSVLQPDDEIVKCDSFKKSCEVFAVAVEDSAMELEEGEPMRSSGEWVESFTEYPLITSFLIPEGLVGRMCKLLSELSKVDDATLTLGWVQNLLKRSEARVPSASGKDRYASSFTPTSPLSNPYVPSSTCASILVATSSSTPVASATERRASRAAKRRAAQRGHNSRERKRTRSGQLS